MAINGKMTRGTEFGDYQTPAQLADRACLLLSRRTEPPLSILEPTCGRGNFLIAAIRRFPSARIALGVDINPDHVREAREAATRLNASTTVCVESGDCFKIDWERILDSLPDPLLIIGNPPWVTNSTMGSVGAPTLPVKSNFRKDRGLDAITGKSNFDVSESMLVQAVHWMIGRQATLAMLCKTAVARKVLLHGWKKAIGLDRCAIYLIDAGRFFGVKTHSCLLVASSHPPHAVNVGIPSSMPCHDPPSLPIGKEDAPPAPPAGNERVHPLPLPEEVTAHAPPTCSFDCLIHRSLDDEAPTGAFGFRGGRLIADVSAYERLKHLEGEELHGWRSGIKHDCAAVMELTGPVGPFANGRGESVDIEMDFLFPMLKSSDLNRRLSAAPPRWMLVTQRTVGEDTLMIRDKAPKTWEYLNRHANLLGKRASTIYRNRPLFSIFGVGNYSFTPWKVAISGFYKAMNFTVVGPRGNKAVVFDDTCSFMACESEDEARRLALLLNSETARDFFSSMIFWDAKRPVTIEILRRLDLKKLSLFLSISGT